MSEKRAASRSTRRAPPSVQPSTQTDCVATTATSQPPLMPFSSDGLCSLTVSTANTVYVQAAQSTTQAHQKIWATKTWS